MEDMFNLSAVPEIGNGTGCVSGVMCRIENNL